MSAGQDFSVIYDHVTNNCDFAAIDILSMRNLEIGIPARSRHHPCMKIVTIIARILLALIFVVFGSNAFLHFLPMPPPPEGLVGDYLRVFVASGYIYVIGAMQILGGLLLLTGRFVPLGLTILAAIIFNILVFHALMAPEGFAPGLVVAALELFLIWRYRAAFAGLVRA